MQLFDWASVNVPGAHFGYCSNEGYESEQRILDQRFQQSCTISGTRKLHSFVPVSNSTVEVRSYSSSDASRKERVTLAKDDLPPETIAGFVTCLHDGNWWLACVQEVRLTILHPPSPSSAFRYPQSQDIHTVPIENILTLVDPRTRTGRVYTLTKKDITYASKNLHNIVSQN